MSKEEEKPKPSLPAPAPPRQMPAPKPAQPREGQLPPWRVLLHNDDVCTFGYVITTLQRVAPLNRAEASDRTREAHESGVALLLTTHKELAELYQEQFTSRGLTVTIEKA